MASSEFGLDRKVYTRKPKQAFENLDNVLGQKVSNDASLERTEISDERRNEIKRETERSHRRKAVRSLIIVATILSIIAAVTAMIVNDYIAERNRAYVHNQVAIWQHNMNIELQKRMYTDSIIEMGYEQMQQGNFEKAIKEFRRANIPFPKDSAAALGMIRAHVCQCVYEKNACKSAIYYVQELSEDHRRHPSILVLRDVLNRRKFYSEYPIDKFVEHIRASTFLTEEQD